MDSENGLGSYLDHAAKVAAAVYHSANRDGSIPAIGREAVADIRNTMHEMFFGKSERGGQPGTPGNPLFHDMVEARNDHEAALASAAVPSPEPVPLPGDIVAQEHRGSVYGPEKGVLGPEQGVYGPERGGAGQSPNAGLPLPGDIAHEQGPHGVEPGQEMQLAQAGPSPAPIPGGFVDALLKERKGSDFASELARGRVLPDEQLENNKGRDR